MPYSPDLSVRRGANRSRDCVPSGETNALRAGVLINRSEGLKNTHTHSQILKHFMIMWCVCALVVHIFYKFRSARCAYRRPRAVRTAMSSLRSGPRYARDISLHSQLDHTLAVTRSFLVLPPHVGQSTSSITLPRLANRLARERDACTYICPTFRCGHLRRDVDQANRRQASVINRAA